MSTLVQDYRTRRPISSLEEFQKVEKLPDNQGWKVFYQDLRGLVRKKDGELFLKIPCLFAGIEAIEPVKKDKTEPTDIYRVWRPEQLPTIFNIKTGYEVGAIQFRLKNSTESSQGVIHAGYLKDSKEFILVNDRFVFQVSKDRTFELPFKTQPMKICHYKEVHEDRFLVSDGGTHHCVVNLAGDILVEIK